MGGGGQANFTGKCTNFLNGAASPARNGAPANCAGAASAAGERPAGRFPPFPRPRAKGRSRPPRLGRRGPRPGESQRPPRARSRARAGGADDRHQPGPGETAGAAPRPREAPATFAGGEFRRARAGAGGAAAALWAAIQCRAFLKRGVWGVSPWGDPPRTTRLPGDGPGGTRREPRKRAAPGQRRASAPPRGRGRRRRGAARLMPGVVVQRGSYCSIRCAAAWRPVVHALPRILPPGYSWVVRSSAWEMMLHAASQPCT